MVAARPVKRRSVHGRATPWTSSASGSRKSAASLTWHGPCRPEKGGRRKAEAGTEEHRIAARAAADGAGHVRMGEQTPHLRRHRPSTVLHGGAWSAHDLRRTGATFILACGAAGDIVERCQNHALTTEAQKNGSIRHCYGPIISTTMNAKCATRGTGSGAISNSLTLRPHVASQTHAWLPSTTQGIQGCPTRPSSCGTIISMATNAKCATRGSSSGHSWKRRAGARYRNCRILGTKPTTSAPKKRLPSPRRRKNHRV